MDKNFEMPHIKDLPTYCVDSSDGKLVICILKAVPIKTEMSFLGNNPEEWKGTSKNYKKFNNAIIKCRDLVYRVVLSNPFKKGYKKAIKYELEVV
jgi:hypothetical protein